MRRGKGSMSNRRERRAEAARKAKAPLAVVPNLINNEWDSFRERVLSPEAPEVQVTEMRRAFFGGAMALFGSLMTKFDEGEEETERDLAQMDAIDKELRDFGARVGKGRW
jgi:hypothetical protein